MDFSKELHMATGKSGWDNIPSLKGLEVDWQYEPENPLGKRAWLRIASTQFYTILGVKNIPVKLASKTVEETGHLLDVSQGGFSAVVKTNFTVGQLLKVGFFIGKQKVISRAVVKYVTLREERFKVGVEFVDLDGATKQYIAGIVAAKVFQQPL